MGNLVKGLAIIAGFAAFIEWFPAVLQWFMFLVDHSFIGKGEISFSESFPGMLGFFGFPAAYAAPLLTALAVALDAIGSAMVEKEERQEEEEQRRVGQVALEKANYDRDLAFLKRYIRNAQDSALALPCELAEAELALDRAEDKFAERVPSPFWEAMERATASLVQFDRHMHAIAEQHTRYKREAPAFRSDAPQFTIGSGIIPDPEPTHTRLDALFHDAQKTRRYAEIYELRRMASKVDQTNAILVAGFTSLGDAVAQLGEQIANSLSDLQEDLDFRLNDLQGALESAAETAKSQRGELLSEIRSDSQVNLDHSRAAEKHRADVIKKLENIQRRRRPYPKRFDDNDF